MKYWLFNKDPYFMVYEKIPQTKLCRISSPIYPINNRCGPFFSLLQFSPSPWVLSSHVALVVLSPWHFSPWPRNKGWRAEGPMKVNKHVWHMQVFRGGKKFNRKIIKYFFILFISWVFLLSEMYLTLKFLQKNLLPKIWNPKKTYHLSHEKNTYHFPSYWLF